jgi:hypothetical protein
MLLNAWHEKSYPNSKVWVALSRYLVTVPNPTNLTVLDEMLAYSHYQTSPSAICINQDVPTCFYAVQRNRLWVIGSQIVKIY